LSATVPSEEEYIKSKLRSSELRVHETLDLRLLRDDIAEQWISRARAEFTAIEVEDGAIQNVHLERVDTLPRVIRVHHQLFAVAAAYEANVLCERTLNKSDQWFRCGYLITIAPPKERHSMLGARGRMARQISPSCGVT
jgi:hypothetical protein